VAVVVLGRHLPALPDSAARQADGPAPVAPVAAPAVRSGPALGPPVNRLGW
jgi:hypothetical protein